MEAKITPCPPFSQPYLQDDEYSIFIMPQHIPYKQELALERLLGWCGGSLNLLQSNSIKICIASSICKYTPVCAVSCGGLSGIVLHSGFDERLPVVFLLCDLIQC